MFSAAMSNSASLSEEATTTVSFSSGTKVQNFTASSGHIISTIPTPQQPQKIKKKRSPPGNPDPDAEVVALSPKTLMTTNRYVCEICKKGFQRDQNLQLHRRGHNLPWKLKQRNSEEVKKRVYVCPEASCVHHHPSRALGDLTGIKKHYCRKHGEKKWKCHKCSRIYAVQSDWKAHSKTCGTREYRCDCGNLFSRKDSFITHRAFCDALAAEESARLGANQLAAACTNPMLIQSLFPFQNQMMMMMMMMMKKNHPWDSSSCQENPNPSYNHEEAVQMKTEVAECFQVPCPSSSPPYVQVMMQEQNQKNMMTMTNPFLGALPHAATSPHLSPTALLRKAATVGPTATTGPQSTIAQPISTGEFGLVTQAGHDCMGGLMTRDQNDPLTRDFLGLTAYVDGARDGGSVDVGLMFTGGVEYDLFKSQQDFGFFGP